VILSNVLCLTAPIWVGSGKLLPALTSTVIPDSRSHMTQDCNFLFFCLMILAIVQLPCSSHLVWINCCSPLPAQSFLVPGPTGLMTIFFVTTLGIMQLLTIFFSQSGKFLLVSPAQSFLIKSPAGLMTYFTAS
jgi:hypothetical protein